MKSIEKITVEENVYDLGQPAEIIVTVVRTWRHADGRMWRKATRYTGKQARRILEALAGGENASLHVRAQTTVWANHNIATR